MFSRILIGLLAVFYVSIFAIEAFHSHDSLIEVSSSDGVKDGVDAGGSEANSCNICAYFAQHDQKEITVSILPSFALFLSQERLLNTSELTGSYQTCIQDFVNRGPPYFVV